MDKVPSFYEHVSGVFMTRSICWLVGNGNIFISLSSRGLSCYESEVWFALAVFLYDFCITASSDTVKTFIHIQPAEYHIWGYSSAITKTI